MVSRGTCRGTMNGYVRPSVRHKTMFYRNVATHVGNVTSAGWQVTLCDPMWHVSSRSGVATLRTCYLLTYLLTYVELSTGLFRVTRSYRTHQLTGPTQPNPTQLIMNQSVYSPVNTQYEHNICQWQVVPEKHRVQLAGDL